MSGKWSVFLLWPTQNSFCSRLFLTWLAESLAIIYVLEIKYTGLVLWNDVKINVTGMFIVNLNNTAFYRCRRPLKHTTNVVNTSCRNDHWFTHWTDIALGICSDTNKYHNELIFITFCVRVIDLMTTICYVMILHALEWCVYSICATRWFNLTLSMCTTKMALPAKNWFL